MDVPGIPVLPSSKAHAQVHVQVHVGIPRNQGYPPPGN